MSRFNIAQFNIWFPATVISLFIAILGACVLAILRRYCPCIGKLLGNHSDAEAAPQAASQPQGNQRREAIERMYASIHDPAAAPAPAPPAAEHHVQIGNGAVEATVTAWFPDSCLPEGFAAGVYEFIAQRAQGLVRRFRGSVVIQALVSIDSRALRELEEFAKQCSCEVEGFYVQIGEWGIFYHNGESFQLYRLKEAEAPEIVEAVWHNSGFIVRGFYLNGSGIKEATEKSSTTLRTAGPPLQACGLLEELYVPTEGLDVGKSLVFAFRVIEVDGYPLTVRSQATYVVPPNEKSFKEPSSGGSLLKILSLIMKMKSLLRFPGRQPKTAQRAPKRLEGLEKMLEIPVSNLKTCTQRQYVIEYWKGVSGSEMIDFRTKVLHNLQQLSSSSNRHLSQYNFATSMLVSSGDQEYWQRGLNDLNEVIRLNADSSQSSLLFRIRARTKLFLGQFDSALQDFGEADKLYAGRPSSTDMLERAIVKCALGRYSEAMQDVMAASAINPNWNHVKASQSCLEQILHLKLQDDIHGPDGPDLLISNDTIHVIPDLLTGDKWTPDHMTSTVTRECYSDRISSMLDMKNSGREALEYLEHEIEASKTHWSDLQTPSMSDMKNSGREALELKEAIEALKSNWSELPMFSKEKSSLQLWRESLISGFKVGMKIAEGGQAEIYKAKWVFTGEDLQMGKKIAEGARAEIYEAKWKYTGQDLVVKKFMEGFPADHLVWLTDSSPGICRAVGVIKLEDHTLALVLPRYWGDLRRLIDQRTTPFDVTTSVAFMLQIAEGMLILHERGVVHRDIKPANVLFSRCGEHDTFHCKIAGFGCAPRVLETQPRGALEIWHPGQKADIFSFGIMCSEILSGRPPFEHDSHVDYDMVMFSGLRPPLPPAIAPALRTLIEQCWHADPEQRPDFAFICEALRRISSELVIADQCYKLEVEKFNPTDQIP